MRGEEKKVQEIEQIGKTIEEAKQQAMEKLGEKNYESIDFEILDEGSKGLFGIGIKYAKVKATVKKEDSLDASVAEKLLREIMRYLNADGQISVEKSDDMEILNIYGKDLGLLIGKNGKTLQSIQYVINLIVNREQLEKKKIFIDVERYKAKKEKGLIELAKRTADKVRNDERTVVLDPMQANERRIIHLALKDNPYVSTFSQGDEPLRKVIIAPKQ